MKSYDIVTQSDAVLRQYGIEAGIDLLARTGYTGVDLTMTDVSDIWYAEDIRTTVERLSRAMKACGILPMQAHAPFPGYRFGEEEYNRLYDGYVRHAISVSGELGVPVIVVHPIFCKGMTAREQKQWNMEYYGALADHARSSGVKIALENMWGRDPEGHKIPNVCSLSHEFNSYVDELDPGVFTACADLGHFPLVGEPAPDAIRAMGSRITRLHIHDNDLVDDSHLLPFCGRLGWEGIAAALADIDYGGPLTFETDPGLMRRLPRECLPSALAALFETGVWLAKEINQRRS